jgi:hypothetical protein
MRFNTNKYSSLNESITKVQNPQTALEEAMEYTAALEAVIVGICEKLDLDPDALVEEVFNSPRSARTQRVMSEGVIRNTIQRIKNKVKGSGFSTDRELEQRKKRADEARERAENAKAAAADRAERQKDREREEARRRRKSAEQDNERRSARSDWHPKSAPWE